MQTPEDFPICLKVEDVANILRVSRAKAYEMTRRKDFPAIRDGSRIIIPRDRFFDWLNETALQAAAE